MAILLVQLSDIHFHWPEDGVASRVTALKQALISKIPRADACFILLSGDIANSGASEEYAIAKRFIDELRSSLNDAGISRVEIVAIPGNHDLNLQNEPDTRQLILESPDAYLRKGVDFLGLNFDAIISVQDDFFRFESSVSGQPILKNPEKLYYRRHYQVGSQTIVFHCFNTAWLSRRHELQAKLYLPETIFAYNTPRETTLSVAMFHHPYNWLNAENQRFLKNFVERQADVVLTGHEHEAGVDRRLSIKGQGLDYIQAPAFSDPKIPENGFQILVADFDQKSQQIVTFNWDGSRFTETDSANWTLHRNSLRPANPFDLRAEFVAELQDMGTGFRHPRCVPPQCELQLRDLYIYPDFQHQRLDKVLAKDGGVIKTIRGNQFTEFLDTHRNTLIFGADDCGKTSFARILFEDLTAKDFIPLLLKGEELRGANKDSALVKVISRSVVEQYAASSPEPYLQANKDRKVVIIDDFGKAKLSKEAQTTVIDLLQGRFGGTVILASDLVQIQDMTKAGNSEPFFGFERCTMKEFGKFHRQKLIRAWLSLGLEDSEEVENIDKTVIQTDKTLSTLLGKNVLPHHPVTILTLLQMLESKETTNTANGAYGYMYEVLLKSALAKVNPKDVDEKITYISGIGHAMFRAKQPVLTEEELRKAHLDYCDRYDMVRDFPKMIADLLNAEVLIESKNSYRFKYPYGFYYSTAKYFQSRGAASRQELYNMADHIYGEVNANVLIFYVYLTKDEELIRHIVANARRIYANLKPCDMQQDVEFINKLSTTKPPPLELECGEADNHRDDHNRKQDTAEEQSSFVTTDDVDVTYDEKLQEIVKITIAFKTLQILGQVLRNFTGSLEGPLKLDITKECYALGMRTLTAILSIAGSDIDAMRQYLGSLIAERSGITDKQELASKTNDAIVWLGTAAAFGSVKRISYAVGHSDLTNTYGRVLEQNGELSTQVIDAAIKLDHFERVPDKELNKLEGRVQKNNFAHTVVRDLVADYLYLYSVDFPTMQKLGAKWNISVSAPKFLTNRSKK
jgi:predicted MPP superfamily phosphohydrolase